MILLSCNRLTKRNANLVVVRSGQNVTMTVSLQMYRPIPISRLDHNICAVLQGQKFVFP